MKSAHVVVRGLWIVAVSRLQKVNDFVTFTFSNIVLFITKPIKNTDMYNTRLHKTSTHSITSQSDPISSYDFNEEDWVHCGINSSFQIKTSSIKSNVSVIARYYRIQSDNSVPFYDIIFTYLRLLWNWIFSCVNWMERIFY